MSSIEMERARKFFLTGRDAMQRENHEYAVEMLVKACALAPDVLEYRKTLRGAQRLKFHNDPHKVGMLVGTKTQPLKIRARSSRSKGDWKHALEIYEEVFCHNPWDVAAALESGEIFLERDWNEHAKWSVESVASVAKKDAHYLMQLAEVYRACREYERASQILLRVRQLKPSEEVDQAIKRVDAEQAITKNQDTRSREFWVAAATKGAGGGEEEEEFEGTGSGPTPGSGDTMDLAVTRLVSTSKAKSAEERLMEDIERNPGLVGPYLRAADHFKASGDLSRAEKILIQGGNAVAGDETILGALAEVQLAILEKYIGKCESALEGNPRDAATREKLHRLRERRDELELKEARRRLAGEPSNHEHQFRLGVVLARLGSHDEAIKCFQGVRNDPKWKVEALLHAGCSFEAKGMAKLAERSYQDALKALENDGDSGSEALFKKLHYRLGRVAEAQGHAKEAEEHYTEVANLDFDYEDVAKRIENLNS